MPKTVYLQCPQTGRVFSTLHPEFHKDCRRASKKEYEQKNKEQACTHLRKLLKPGDTVYGCVKSVARSGMSRKISFYIAHEGQILDITGNIANSKNQSRNSDGTITVTGCGMNMVFHEVYNLGLRLWPNGTAVPCGTRNGQPDTHGGYALKSAHL